MKKHLVTVELMSLSGMVEIPRLQAKRSWAVGSLGERRPRVGVLGAKRPHLRLQSASAEQRTPRLPVEGRSVLLL